MQTDPLTQALFLNYRRAGEEAGYWGNYFLRELRTYGGLEVARRILAKREKGGATKGFLALADAGRPDLSVEAVVLSPRFKTHFTRRELAVARKRLARFPASAWRNAVRPEANFPDELPPGRRYSEGSRKRVQVNVYERDPAARRACLAHHGARCKVCKMRFRERYGPIGKGFIHVHHLRPLSLSRKEYKIDPVKDLVPVCPNCHAMLHTSEPPLSVAELVKVFRPAK